MVLTAQAQDKGILDQYIHTALGSNDALKGKQFELQKSLYALKEAKGLFLPTVAFNASYSLATGGRRIELPVGDLLNPVYATLNQLTQSQSFPQIENASSQLLPSNFYDAKFRVQQPILNTEIMYNKKIKEEQIGLKELEIRTYQRELAKQIKTAYFQYLQATDALGVYDNALVLLAESRRVSKSLIDNGAGLPSILVRADAELARLTASRADAENNQLNATAYFNFLLNRDFNAPIEVDSLYLSPNKFAIDTPAQQEREELSQLRQAQKISDLVLKLNKSYYRPKLNAQLDLGSQDFDFKFNNQSRYMQLGISLDVPIWSGNRNLNKIKEAEMDVAALQTQADAAADQIRLQAEVAKNSYLSSVKVFESYAAQVYSARKFYRDALKRYKEGQSNYIEILDAQTAVTSAELQQSIALSNVWIKAAELERATATYLID